MLAMVQAESVYFSIETPLQNKSTSEGTTTAIYTIGPGVSSSITNVFPSHSNMHMQGPGRQQPGLEPATLLTREARRARSKHQPHHFPCQLRLCQVLSIEKLCGGISLTSITVQAHQNACHQGLVLRGQCPSQVLLFCCAGCRKSRGETVLCAKIRAC